jgi:hypothetical protein
MDIALLKQTHGRIFKATTPLSKVDIYFKLISKREYDNYLRLAPDRNIISPAAEEYIFRVAMVYPDMPTAETKLLAGEFHAIAEAMASRSGFHEMDSFATELKSRRLDTQTLSEQIIGTICKAFPIYKIAELESMNYQEIARLLAISETMLEMRLDIPGAETPDMVEAAKEQEKQVHNKPVNLIRPPNTAQMSDEEQAVVERQRSHALEVLQASRNKRLF